MFCHLSYLFPVAAALGELEAPTSEGLGEHPPDSIPAVSRRGEVTQLGVFLSSDTRASLCVWLPDFLPGLRMSW